MIITNLTGGLGNQMFQYAFGRYLALKNNTNLKLHFTNALFNTQYSYGLDVFKIQAEIATDEDLINMKVVKNRIINRLLYLIDERFCIQLNDHIVTQKYPYTFDFKYQNIKNNTYVQGFWADEKYFKEIEYLLKKEIYPKEDFDKKNKRIAKIIQNTDSVSIHVRRGDYVNNIYNPKAIVLGIEYYINSIKIISKKVKKPVYFVFSNDIEWCRQNLKIRNKTYFIDHNKGSNSYRDIQLMSLCKHNIIANSTFSWWGAWLNSNKCKILIKPINEKSSKQ